MRSEEARTGLARVNPLWTPAVRTYAKCRNCGAKQPLEVLQAA